MDLTRAESLSQCPILTVPCLRTNPKQSSTLKQTLVVQEATLDAMVSEGCLACQRLYKDSLEPSLRESINGVIARRGTEGFVHLV